MTRQVVPLSVLFLATFGAALDVQLISQSCDQSLPVTANITLLCNGKSRCTFGSESEVSGSLSYHGVYNSGIQNELGYVTATMNFFSLNFNLFDMQAVPLCDQTMTASASNVNSCPGDGSYDFSLAYKLPSAGTGTTAWLASGWQGSGLITMYAQQNKNMLIGKCTLELQTYVTPGMAASQKYLFGLSTPSAAVFAGILLAIVALAVMVTTYCYCCCRRKTYNRGGKHSSGDDKTVIMSVKSGDVTTFFRQMDDDDEKQLASAEVKSTTGSKKGLVGDNGSVISSLPLGHPSEK